MIESLKTLEEQVALWPGISVRRHQFGGPEFCLGSSEVGHAHPDGAVDIPFPRWFRDEILAESLAEEHRWAPDSGWVTFYLRGQEDVERAVLLLRLSYLRYVLKAVPDPVKRYTQECERLNLSPEIKALLWRFVPHTEETAA